MYTVYVLYSSSFSKIYIGYTSNIEERMRSHNELSKKGWTVKFRPWALVYTEMYEEKAAAMARERSLKTAKGREFIWMLIKKEK
ncbi:MAG: GIY-YIG nuclease family protein [Chitinophagaceae bacterium]